MQQPTIGKARGILNPVVGEKKFRLSRMLPAEELRFFVEHHWIVSWDLSAQQPYVQETLPYPSVHLVFEREQTRVYGVETGKFARLLQGAGQVFGVKFRPGAFYPFIHSPVSALTNRSVSFQDAFGFDGKQLEDALLACQDEGHKKEIAERFLLDRHPERDENIRKINQVVEYIIAHPEVTRVDDVVNCLGLEKRAVQRLFHHYVGVGPKWVIKRYQLHEGVERLAEGEAIDGTRIAQELGYFDQAHFIKDFKAVVGRTPSEYVKSLPSTSEIPPRS